MPEWVRVKDPDTGHEITMSTEQANAVGASPVDTKNATTASGDPRPPKYHTTVAEAAASRKGA